MSGPAYPPGVRPFRPGDEIPILAAMPAARGRGEFEGVAGTGSRSPPLRGRGLGRELVRWGVTDVRRRGAGEVFLSVEGESEGALRLYESLGFARHVEWPHWVLPADLGARPTP